MMPAPYGQFCLKRTLLRKFDNEDKGLSWCTQMSADLSAGMSVGCEDDDVPPAPADFQPGLAAYEGMEALTSMGELESLSSDMGFMGLAAAMPDYSDLEYAAHRVQARLMARPLTLSSHVTAVVGGG